MQRQVVPRNAGVGCEDCCSAPLWRSGDHVRRRVVCSRCGSCSETTADPWEQVNSISCEGCELVDVCTSRPTAAALAMSSEHSLDDDTAIIVRLLLFSDYHELRDGYEVLSAPSRYLRFFVPPKHLSSSALRYLTDLDYSNRYALGAYQKDDPTQQGIGIARWSREPSEPTRAEAAVVVADEWHGRGVGRALLISLVDSASEKGISTFTADVLWANHQLISSLRSRGATIKAAEPGVARVEFDLTAAQEDFDRSDLNAMLTTAAEYI